MVDQRDMNITAAKTAACADETAGRTVRRARCGAYEQLVRACLLSLVTDGATEITAYRVRGWLTRKGMAPPGSPSIEALQRVGLRMAKGKADPRLDAEHVCAYRRGVWTVRVEALP